MCLLVSLGAGAQTERLAVEGVSWELAEFRKQAYKDLMYSIFLSIPEDKSQDIEVEEVVTLCLDAPHDIILDFR